MGMPPTLLVAYSPLPRYSVRHDFDLRDLLDQQLVDEGNVVVAHADAAHGLVLADGLGVDRAVEAEAGVTLHLAFTDLTLPRFFFFLTLHLIFDEAAVPIPDKGTDRGDAGPW